MTLLDAIISIFSGHAFAGPLAGAIQAVGWGLAASFTCSVLIVLTKPLHGALSMDLTDGVQKFHTVPTPRIGGIPIVVGLALASIHASPVAMQMMLSILLAGLPAFLFGLAEDVTKRVGVMHRLLATMAAGVLAWMLTGYAITRVDIWGVDWLLQFSLLSVLFTAFAVGGVANSINIIDGFNGLASTASTLAFIGYALIAYQVEDMALASVALVLAACVWGFFWVNWPLGKIFLGDGGSYFIGFSLAWVAVMLIERNAQVSAFAALLVCVHPVTEVLFSIYRRRIKKMHPGQPDRMHFHSLVKQRYVRRWFSDFSQAALFRARQRRSPGFSLRRQQKGQRVDGAHLQPSIRVAHYWPALFHSIRPLGPAGYVAVAVYQRHPRRTKHRRIQPRQDAARLHLC